jgi:hypothetical protein
MTRKPYVRWDIRKRYGHSGGRAKRKRGRNGETDKRKERGSEKLKAQSTDEFRDRFMKP